MCVFVCVSIGLVDVLVGWGWIVRFTTDHARVHTGRWMAAARSEGAERIIQDQLLPAVERAKAPIEGNAGGGAGGGARGTGVLGAGTRQRRRAHLTLANFLADLYQRRCVCVCISACVCACGGMRSICAS